MQALKADARPDPARPARHPFAAALRIGLVCGLAALITVAVALWSISAAVTPSKADVSRIVSAKLDGPSPVRHELARPDGPVVQSLADQILANHDTFVADHRVAIARACGLTALVGALLAALAGWFAARSLSRPTRWPPPETA
jgi:hypothetical protein